MKRIYVEPTDMCNLDCLSCGRPKGGHSNMSPETFEVIINILKNEGVDAIGYFWRGEPCMHPKLPELVEIGKRHDMHTYVSSNMVAPNLHKKHYVKTLLANLDKLEVCVDGCDQASLSKYRRGAKWEDLLLSLRNICKNKQDCELEMRVLMFRYNDGKEDFYRKLARKNGIDKISFARPIINMKAELTDEEAKEWMSRIPKYQRYKKVNRGGLLKPKYVWVHKSKRCLADQFRGSIIDVDGNFVICPMDYELNHSPGNILNDKMLQIKINHHKMYGDIANKRYPICSNCVCSPQPQVNYKEVVR